VPLTNLVFIIVFVLGVALFAASCYRRFSLITIGTPENRLDSIGKRIWNVVLFPFFQRCTISRNYRFGLNHALLFWCFLVLLIANIEFMLHGLVPGYVSFSRLPDGAYFTLVLIFDIVSILAFLAAVAAIARRLAFPPKYLGARSSDAFVILGLVVGLMIAFFGFHGSEIAVGTERAAASMPVSNLVSHIFPRTASAYSTLFWWLHALIFLSFLNYLPYSKHAHIMTSIPNVFFRRLERVKTQSREEFRKDRTFGVERVDKFSWKSLLDSYSCTECGRCTDLCPATNTGKMLNPRLVIHDIKANLLQNGPLIKQGRQSVEPLVGSNGEGSVTEEVIWQCTTCAACTTVCPVFIEQFPRIIDMRRNLVEMQAKFPQELLSFFENMEQRSNPWGMAPAERTKWTTGLNTRIFEGGQTEYLFYVGCAGAFDTRSKRVTVAIADILDTAGVSWGILGKDEKCCGDSLRRLGNEYIFDKMAKGNATLFRQKGIKKVIAECPHCYNTLKNDYRQYGIELEVFHHTELIDQLIQQGRLKLNNAAGLGNIVLHDSCYLGRYNAIYEAPRRIIAATTGTEPGEMKRHHERSFCCGAGGGRMWMEESQGKRINIERVEEALSKAPNIVSVCCPYCMTMFEDGIKDKNAVDKVKVLDIAEIVSRSLKKS
jgi:Fe-S oxidoreductase